MKMRFCYAFFLCLFIACNSSPSEHQLDKNDLANDTERVIVTKTSEYELTIALPDGWNVFTEAERWAAKDDCADEFCANVVWYQSVSSGELNDSLVQLTIAELEKTYGFSLKIISISPIYTNPSQFSIAYAFGRGGHSFVGYAFVVKTQTYLNLFEVIDEYKKSEEVEPKLNRAVSLCGSVQVELF